MASLKGPPEQQGNTSQYHADRGGYPTPRITQVVPITPGPPRLEPYAPAIPVRVLTLLSLPRMHIQLSYCASNGRRYPTIAPPATYPFLTSQRDRLEEISAL